MVDFYQGEWLIIWWILVRDSDTSTTQRVIGIWTYISDTSVIKESKGITRNEMMNEPC